MFRRSLSVAVVLVAFGSTSAFAAPSPVPFMLFKQCVSQAAMVKQCAFQAVEGDRNTAVTKQRTVQTSVQKSLQFSLTTQKGDRNTAYTEQVGSNQFSLTSQVGNDNAAYTYQEGAHNHSMTIEFGAGNWAATSSIGDGGSTSVVLVSY